MGINFRSYEITFEEYDWDFVFGNNLRSGGRKKSRIFLWEEREVKSIDC